MAEKSLISTQPTWPQKQTLNNQTTTLQNQVCMLKQKAHKSFLQMMQMQQIHQDQLDEMQRQKTQLLEERNKRINELEKKMKILQATLEIYRKKEENQQQNFLPLLQLESLDTIDFHEDSKLQQSFFQIKELLHTTKNIRQKEIIQNFKAQFEQIIKNTSKQTFEKVFLNKFTIMLSQIKYQNEKIIEEFEETVKVKKQQQNQIANLKLQLQLQQKEIAFFTQRMRKIHFEKIQLEKRIEDMEHLRKHQVKYLKSKDENRIGSGKGLTEIQNVCTTKHRRFNSGQINDQIKVGRIHRICSNEGHSKIPFNYSWKVAKNAINAQQK